MTKILKLYNTFTKSLNAVEISGHLVRARSLDFSSDPPLKGSFYICGPTVYADCHLGHALTYIRADLLRRFFASHFGVRLTTVMNITDIDDKILAVAKDNPQTRQLNPDQSSKLSQTQTSDPSSHAYNKVGDKYYASFLRDMESIRVQPADLYVRVSRNINLITSFIRKLEQTGKAYMGRSGDVYFKTNSIENYKGRIDPRVVANDGPLNERNDVRDFVLWKASKPGEPIWMYRSSVVDRVIPGRPGWHVQCSAIASALFGNKLDCHFGGKDLIFPHHYNEEACCCAYHNLDTSKSLHAWSNHWLHSGLLTLKESKMSKSLGNGISIKDILGLTSVNILRLLCVANHYRTDLELTDELLSRIKILDHKINAFGSFLTEEISRAQDNLSDAPVQASDEVKDVIKRTHDDIVEGICDDFHLEKGLESILDLAKYMYSLQGTGRLNPDDLISSLHLLRAWCSSCGLDYRRLNVDSSENVRLVTLLSEFRNDMRAWTLKELKKAKKSSAYDEDRITSLEEIMKRCDKVRVDLDDLGFVTRDPKSS